MTEQQRTDRVSRCAPVGGEFAVTGTLPTLQDVISFKEGSVDSESGYYRFVLHPYLRELAADLMGRFRCRHCRLGESRQSVLRELIFCLAGPGSRSRLVKVVDQRGESAGLASFFDELGRAGIRAEKHGRDFDPADIVLISCKDPSALLTGESASLLQRIQSAGAQLIVMLPTVPPDMPEVPPARFWVTGLSADDSSITGGAVLSNLDRPMGRLAEWMKRRGAFLSVRNAALFLGRPAPSVEARAGAAASVAATLCSLERGTRAFLYPSGMSAVTSILDVLRQPGRSRVVSIGHLYGDTFDSLRFAGREPAEEENLFLAVDQMDRLPAALTGQTAAVLTESITNPLSDVPDLTLIAGLAKERGIPFIVDNTIATPMNCTPLDLGADVVVHSTTKFLNGKNNHAGGALIVRDSGLAQSLARQQEVMNNGMSPLEAAELRENLATFDGRMRRFNANGAAVAGFLAGHPAVRRLYFNGHPSHRCYRTARRILRGSSSVIGMTLMRDNEQGLRAFYDSPMPGITKAPSLGSDVTLMCPYVMLAHYNDSEEVLESFGASRWLVRLSVGSEPDIRPVIESLDRALSR
ncbi:MAG TPA: PLP-dependent transferase [Spirochaetia bacterium]|nr:PLP-dependent transferase [Spirochaetia bacterium]